MKKVIMLLSAVAILSVSSMIAKGETIFIAPENFKGTAYFNNDAMCIRENVLEGISLNAWSRAAVPEGSINPSEILTRGGNNSRGTEPALTKVYVEETGDYFGYIQIYAKSDTPRLSSIRVDGDSWKQAEDYAGIMPDSYDWVWTRTEPIHLEAGWHTVELIGDKLNLRAAAIIFMDTSKTFLFPSLPSDTIAENEKTANELKDTAFPEFVSEPNMQASSNSIVISGFDAQDINDSGIKSDTIQYSVDYKKSEDDKYSEMGFVDNTMAEISNLSSETEYTVRVRAVDKFGQYAEKIQQITTEAAGETPKFPEGSSINYTEHENSIDIQWNSAYMSNGAAEKYKLMVNDTVYIIEAVEALLQKFTIENTEPNTKYSIEVAGINADGDTGKPLKIEIKTQSVYTVVLNAKNIKVDGEWSVSTDSESAFNITSDGAVLYSSASSTKSPATAKVYVPKDGIYYVYARTKSGAVSNGAALSNAAYRNFNIQLDGNNLTKDGEVLYWGKKAYSEGKEFGYYWEQADSVALKTGWHEFSIFAGTLTRLDMLMISEKNINPEIFPSTKSEYSKKYSQYEDIMPPEFNEASIKPLTNTSVLIAWGDAVDDNFEMYKLYQITDDEQTEIELNDSNYISISELRPYQKLKFKICALDRVGNSTDIELEAKTGELSIEDYKVDNSNVSFKVCNYDNKEKTGIILTALYSETGEILSSKISENIAFTSESEQMYNIALDYTGNISNCVIKTMIWNSIDEAEVLSDYAEVRM